MKGVPLTARKLKFYDCVVVVTDHRAFDYGTIVRNSKAIVDTRNALKDFNSEKIRRI
jgi:UDP-N-acetyl-D-glucosamine dehydrogenase